MNRKIKGNPLAFAIWTLVSCGVHILLFQAKVRTDHPLWQRLLIAVAAIACILLVHEWIHAVFMKIFYRGKVRLIFAKGLLGLPMPGVTTTGRAKKWQEIIMLLSPFVLLTLLPDVIFVLSPAIEPFFFFVAIGNCAGCFHDLADAVAKAKSAPARH